MTDSDAVSKQGTEEEKAQDPMHEMAALLDAEGLVVDFPKAGEIRDGIIASINEGQILVSVGAKSEGIITGKEYEAIPQKFLADLKVGDTLPVYIVTPEDQSGNLILSITRAVEEQSWIDAEALLESGEVFESEIISYNKGGLLVPLSTIRGFIPASQLSLSRRLSITGESPEAKYKDFLGEKVKVSVIEVDRERHRLILSERAASNETRDMIRDKVMEELEEGEVRTGRVTSLADFGAFVSIGGADGLVHLSEISWDRLTHPSQALKVGDEVRVKVISVDRDRRRIGLSIRQLQGDPWSEQIASLKIGQLVEGEITRLTSFGAFAKLNMPGELEGLIHISELSDKRVEHPKEVLKVGDIVPLRIIKIDDETHRIGLSMRKVDSPAYADQDWKTIAADFDVSVGGGEGESMAAFVGQAEDSAAEPVEAVKDTVEDAVETVKDKAEDVVEDVKDAVEEPVKEAKETAEDVVEKVKDKAGDVIEDVKETAGDVVEKVKDKVEDVVEDVKDFVEEPVEAVSDFVEDAVETVKEKAEDIIEDVKEAFEKPAKDVADKVEDVVDDVTTDEDKAA